MELLSKQALIEKINNVEVNQVIPLEDTNIIYSYIKIIEKNGEFSWLIGRSFKKEGRCGFIHPISGSDNIRYFKTMNGVKRNLIYRISVNWESIVTR